jgi:hypothetical protein
MKLLPARLGWIAAILLPIAAVPACSSNRDLFVGQDCDHGFCDNPVGFEAPDAGDAEASVPIEVPMCPVTTCSFPRMTCPSSEYPCDVDILRDENNCGGCGGRCGDGPTSNWRCVDGKCTFSCGALSEDNPFAMLRNCDGDPTNGCETDIWFDANNCGGCGTKCADGLMCLIGECASMCELLGMTDDCAGTCTNLSRADDNCGTCGTVCDPSGPNKPALPSDMYYGCGNYECGKAKCKEQSKRNCNGDVSDGCEATIHTNEHCGACDDVCAPGKQCLLLSTGYYACACEDDADTLCGNRCLRLDSDAQNCGGCDRACPGLYRPHFRATCTQGVCGGQCEDGYADCDGLPDNGCEVDTRIDNRNCGACGSACERGQVCSEGKCLVAPCEDGPGVPTK